MILGAPFDGGTSHRSGTRFGPQYIRQTCYLPPDGSRPSLALRVDGLKDLTVYDAGDVEMYSGDAEKSVRDLQEAVYAVARSGAIPLTLGGDHTVAWPDAAGVAQHLGQGRVSMIHFDAHADTGDITFGSLIGHGQPMRRLIESGAVRGDRFLQMGLRGYWPRAGDAGLDGRAGHAVLRDDRDRRARLHRMPHRGVRHRHRRLRRGVPVGGHRCLRPGARAGHRHPGARWPVGPAAAGRGPPDRLRAAGGRHRRGGGVPARTTTPRSPRSWPTGWCWSRCPASPGAARTPGTAPPGIPSNPCSTAAEPTGPIRCPWPGYPPSGSSATAAAHCSKAWSCSRQRASARASRSASRVSSAVASRPSDS